MTEQNSHKQPNKITTNDRKNLKSLRNSVKINTFAE